MTWHAVRSVVFQRWIPLTASHDASKRTGSASFLFFAPLCLLLLSCQSGRAQALSARLSVVTLTEPARIRVEGNYAPGSEAWSFRNTYGRVTGLGNRIQNLSLADASGVNVAVRKVGPGEFRSDHAATHFTYEVSLGQPLNPADAAHISTLNDSHGYLMLADLLPDFQATGIRVGFQLPEAWHIASSAAESSRGWYDLPDPANAVFFLGRNLREKRKAVGATEFVLVTEGEWPIAGNAVTEIAAKIIKDHTRHVGFDPKARVVLMLAPFPGLVGSERWSAETRGSNVVLIVGRNSPANTLLGQLSVVLSHELLHVWVPNSLSLNGDYDWFFEGFTLYQALRCAVRLGFISFQEYLDTLGRVYDSYLATPERDRLSLVEASRRRWTIGSSLVYDKGMLVAFLCDLKLREAGRNGRSLDDVYQELFRSFPKGRRADGNEALISILNQQVGNEQFTGRYIQTSGSIDLETILPLYGIEVRDSGRLKRLLVDDGITNEQRDLLVSLGYRRPRRQASLHLR